jgi:hypothetical protein
LTTPEPHETPAEETRPLPVDGVEPLTAVAPAVAEPEVAPEPAPPAPVASVTRVEHETVYVPLAVSIGDGFKLGCGFFLALVIAMLVGFVLLALLFVLSSIVGLNLPLSR